jgi:hypothetical protein
MQTARTNGVRYSSSRHLASPTVLSEVIGTARNLRKITRSGQRVLPFYTNFIRIALMVYGGLIFPWFYFLSRNQKYIRPPYRRMGRRTTIEQRHRHGHELIASFC